MSIKAAIDIGYSSTKVMHNNKLYKIPTAVSYAGSSVLEYGESGNIIDFEGEKYVVGNPNETSFVTTDYKFLHKYAPLIIYKALKTVGINDIKNVSISTGLAISDWPKRQELINRIHEISEINGEPFEVKVTAIVPQGAGAFIDYTKTIEPEIMQMDAMVIDIGFNTINTILFQNGKPDRNRAYAHVGKGVTTIVKEFTNFLELEFNMPFSDQEALKIFMKKRFVFNGVEQAQVAEKIETLKKQFIKQLFQSVLVSEKKYMATSDRVIIAGGGCYLLQGVPLPPSVKFVKEPYEFSNVRGYYLNAFHH